MSISPTIPEHVLPASGTEAPATLEKLRAHFGAPKVSEIDFMNGHAS